MDVPANVWALAPEVVLIVLFSGFVLQLLKLTQASADKMMEAFTCSLDKALSSIDANTDAVRKLAERMDGFIDQPKA